MRRLIFVSWISKNIILPDAKYRYRCHVVTAIVPNL